MRILHVIGVKNPKGNGVATAVHEYVRHEANYVNVAVLNIGTTINFPEDIRAFQVPNYKHIPFIFENNSAPDLVVFNEVYKTEYLKLFKECIRRKIPYVIIPHGSLTKQAQQKKKIKKLVANSLYFNRFIKNASAIQFLNQYEMNETKIKYKKAIISGNGIDPKNDVTLPTASATKDFVYIGRYDKYHKGLDLIIDTCEEYADWFRKNSVHINLYGRNSTNTREELISEIIKRGVSDIIHVNNGIYGTEKEAILNSAYCFIQTSRYEGQPMGIIEALAYGVPCIVSFGSSFGEYINSKQCGIGVNFKKDELFTAIKQMATDKEFRDKCSLNTKKARKDYDWEQISKKCIADYKSGALNE